MEAQGYHPSHTGVNLSLHSLVLVKPRPVHPQLHSDVLVPNVYVGHIFFFFYQNRFASRWHWNKQLCDFWPRQAEPGSALAVAELFLRTHERARSLDEFHAHFSMRLTKAGVSQGHQGGCFIWLGKPDSSSVWPSFPYFLIFATLLTGYKAHVLLCFSNKSPHSGWLVNSRNALLAALPAGSLRPGCRNGGGRTPSSDTLAWLNSLGNSPGP